MKTNFDIDALRAVVSGIEQGSFARAAIELGRSQSAVSMQLKKLEQQAGVQLFVRKGRGLVPTEAGEAFADYARRIIALNDEAARAVGAPVAPETVWLGLPQDFCDDVMPATVQAFANAHPDVHVAVRAGNNHTLNNEIEAGRLDGAIAFFPDNSGAKGELLCKLPIRWLAHAGFDQPAEGATVPLVLFNHPCLFRQAALASLDKAGRRWRAVLTTPSLPAIWAGLRSGFGIGVRIEHSVPDDIATVGHWPALPDLPPVELRLLGAQTASPAARDLLSVLRRATMDFVEGAEPTVPTAREGALT
ncbi:MAG: LysR family transcriptional regulator [Pseudomonadota bacterium]